MKSSTTAVETKDTKLSFRVTPSLAARLDERAKVGESQSQTAGRVLAEALAQTSFDEALASLPTLVAASQALINDVPKALSEAIVAEVSAQSAKLMSQKMNDFAAAQAARDDQNRLVHARLLESISKIEATQVMLAKGIVGLQKAFA